MYFAKKTVLNSSKQLEEMKKINLIFFIYEKNQDFTQQRFLIKNYYSQRYSRVHFGIWRAMKLSRLHVLPQKYKKKDIPLV